VRNPEIKFPRRKQMKNQKNIKLDKLEDKPEVNLQKESLNSLKSLNHEEMSLVTGGVFRIPIPISIDV